MVHRVRVEPGSTRLPAVLGKGQKMSEGRGERGAETNLNGLADLASGLAEAASPGEVAAVMGRWLVSETLHCEAWLVWPSGEPGRWLTWPLGTQDPAEPHETSAPLPPGEDKPSGRLVLRLGADFASEAALVLDPGPGWDSQGGPVKARLLQSLLTLTFERLVPMRVLSRGKAEWEKAFDSATDVFLLQGEDGRILRANVAASTLLGIPIVRLIGAPCSTLLPGLGGDADQEGVEWRHRESGRTFSASTRAVNLEGHSFRLHTLHEVTEERKAAAQAQEQQQVLLTRRMLQGIAHEIRNPLFGISTIAQALQSRFAQDEAAEVYIRQILKEVARLDALIRRFLHLAFLDETTPRQAVPVMELIEEALKTLRSRLPEGACEGAHLGEIPEGAVVLGHRDSLLWAFVELLENGLTVGRERGQVWIDASLRGHTVAVEIRDDGPGVPEEQMERVFEPFFTTRPRRTGLGLSLARSAILGDGGSLSVTNNSPSSGCTFLVVLEKA